MTFEPHTRSGLELASVACAAVRTTLQNVIECSRIPFSAPRLDLYALFMAGFDQNRRNPAAEVSPGTESTRGAG